MGRLNSALGALIDQDANLARAYEAAGAPASRKRAPGFPSLLRIIINQQVSVQAGKAIWTRLEEGLKAVTPEAVLENSADTLRGYGLSRGKAMYARELAGAIAEGSLDLNALKRMDDTEVLLQLTRIKGIGRWTAEIYMMFALGRPDIWPVGDLALAASVERLLGLKKRPDPKKLESIAENWRPWRTSAAVLLWHYYSHAGPMGKK
ncbi:MAG: DNA-3-methyladenine glycosylase 2 family protein [Rhodospirillales bacterium]|nr:DNA-3-methyladenine glycosylase 2 family protein [Alphaproteobacteria bacterium]MBL6948889.1 DNA-3-methyladenine glycosylase 2 family protein [Rhodospirillales bacterium]